ncbi:hypothetical protein Hanom_Chr11g01031291 [Helianthus anomalus]
MLEHILCLCRWQIRKSDVVVHRLVLEFFPFGIAKVITGDSSKLGN